MISPPNEKNYIDTVTSANLDSTFAFEGPEKLLEVWFWESAQSLPSPAPSKGLRSISHESWQSLLDLVNCKILSCKSNDEMNAYVLSESSLFVFTHKVILKTCGTTTTLSCLNKLFELVNKSLFNSLKYVSSSSIYQVFYSRRSFMFPEKQLHVHQGWDREVALLDTYFLNGISYIVGKGTNDDHWHLYIGGTKNIVEEKQYVNSTKRDQTLEILMTELNPEKMIAFMISRSPEMESLFREGSHESDLGHKIGIETMHETGLDCIFGSLKNGSRQLLTPSSSIDCLSRTIEKEDHGIGFTHDAFSFTPCGFSSNSISNQNEGYYYTLHITPENGWSYASFETNVDFSRPLPSEIGKVLKRVINFFDPSKFSVTFMSEAADATCETVKDLTAAVSELKLFDYKIMDHTVQMLANKYLLLYYNVSKSQGK